MTTRVLIAEDEKHLGLLLEHFLVARGHAVTVVHDGREALARIQQGAFDVALLDVQMPGLDGLAVLRGVRELPLPPEVIVMTGNGTVDTALVAMQGGAYDYVSKPYRMAEIDLLVRRAAERRHLAREIAANAAVHARDSEFVTRYAPLRAVLDLVDRAAPRLRTMLVVGEPGTGRATLARRVHARAEGDVFAAAPSLGTDGDALSRLLAAAGENGTLYLRDVDRLASAPKQQLLRALDSSDAPRIVGSVAARGTSSPELLDRLAADVVAELPPLRERVVDVAALVETFVRAFGGASPPVVTDTALDVLERHAWPGNVAELLAVVDGAVARATSGVIGVDELALAARIEVPLNAPEPARRATP